MSLKTVGKILTQDTNCIKCGSQLRIYGKPNEISCGCGAHYGILCAEIVEQQVEMEYAFMGFICIHSTFSDSCKNSCPAPNMYCKDHCSDKAIESAKKEIDYAEQRVIQTKNKLAALEESKKTWLINEMSGLSDEDYTVSKD